MPDTQKPPAEIIQSAHAAAVAVGVATFQCAAIVAALKQAGAMDPENVAKWAECFASMPLPNLTAPYNESIAAALRNFAGVIRSMDAKPAGSGEMWQ